MRGFQGLTKAPCLPQAIGQHHAEKVACLANGPRVSSHLLAPPAACSHPSQVRTPLLRLSFLPQQVGATCSSPSQFPGSGPLYFIPAAFLLPKCQCLPSAFPRSVPALPRCFPELGQIQDSPSLHHPSHTILGFPTPLLGS